MNPLLTQMYQRRFHPDTLVFKNKLFDLLCRYCFQRFIPEDSIVLDVGAGYCEFINNIKAKKKYALDLNPDTKTYANNDVEVILANATDLSNLPDASIDIVFVSNFLEHIPRNDISRLIKEVYRVLKKHGRILIVAPNYRYCYRDYWMFFDHRTALDDRSITELLEIHQFRVIYNQPKFLPYTTKSRFQKSLFLVKIYLQVPLFQKIFGQQVFLVAEKD